MQCIKPHSTPSFITLCWEKESWIPQRCCKCFQAELCFSSFFTAVINRACRTDNGTLRIAGDVKTWFLWPNIWGCGSFSWALVPFLCQSLVFAAPAQEYSISQCSSLQHIHSCLSFLPSNVVSIIIFFFPKLCYFEAFEFILLHISNVSTRCIWFPGFIWVKFANFPLFFFVISLGKVRNNFSLWGNLLQ